MLKFIWKLICLPFTMCRGFCRWYKGLYRGKSWFTKIIIAFISLVFFAISYAAAVQFNFLWLFGDSPSINDIINPKSRVASVVYSCDGKPLHKFYDENRTPVEYHEISQNFFDALIATEDERFYQHRGIDFYGLGAAFKDALTGHPRGASTITQQLVKNIHKMRSRSSGLLGHIPGVRMIIMKSKEMIIATEIEMFCSKEKILEMYANTVDFGSNSFGIKTAAKTYFDTTPADLKIEEAAVLVGILKATSAYNPKINPVNSKRRRNVVLDNMVNQGFITRYKAEELKALEIELKYKPDDAMGGKGLYFRQAVLSELQDIAPELDPDIDGLKIYTTVDSRMQEYAEKAVAKQMRRLQEDFNDNWDGQDPWTYGSSSSSRAFLQEKIKQTDTYKVLAARYPDNPEIVREKLNEKHKVRLFSYNEKGYVEKEMSSMDSLRYMLRFMHTGFVAIEPGTGHVKAYVGDVDYKTWQFDNVRAGHQPGSTFKLFVYATAIKNGLTPKDRRKDEEISIRDGSQKGGVWRPKNANGKFSNDQMSLRSAFAHSVNSIAVKLGQEYGISNVISTAHDMGINSNLVNAPSLPLGSSDVTPYELVSAYTTVANYGTHVEPYCITRIESADGELLYTAKEKSHIALSEREAFYMQALLAAGVKEGTSHSLKDYFDDYYSDNRISVGGKTGTTNNHTDAWFVGVTPKLVAGAWVGGQYRQIHFRSGSLGQGSRAALPIVGEFFRRVMKDRSLAKDYLAVYHTPSGVDASDLRARESDRERPDSLSGDSIDYIPEAPASEGGAEDYDRPRHHNPENARKEDHPADPEPERDGSDLFN